MGNHWDTCDADIKEPVLITENTVIDGCQVYCEVDDDVGCIQVASNVWLAMNYTTFTGTQRSRGIYLHEGARLYLHGVDAQDHGLIDSSIDGGLVAGHSNNDIIIHYSRIHDNVALYGGA